MDMKNVLKLEELAMFVVSAYALYFLQQPWWVFLLLLFAPDISMLGYLGGNTSGALSYNFFHNKGIALFIFLVAILISNQILMIVAIILFGHSSFDRMLGYGLKFKQGFAFTHLGKIGKEK
jgi:hypothetical protein